MTHYKLIVYGETEGDAVVWGTEFDSLKAAKEAARWFATHDFHTTVIEDSEDAEEEAT